MCIQDGTNGYSMKCTSRTCTAGAKKIHPRAGMKVRLFYRPLTPRRFVTHRSYVLNSQGEMGFFDFYVIPLARKLKECGVFGVSSDEYLQYALENRREWEMKCKDVSEVMVTKFFESNPDFMPLRTAWRSGAPSQE